VRAYPRGERSFVVVSGREGKHRQHAVAVVRCRPETVQFEKQLDSDERGTLVAVDERMVARNAEALGRGKLCAIRLAVRGDVSRARAPIRAIRDLACPRFRRARRAGTHERPQWFRNPAMSIASLRQLAKDRAALLHDRSRDFHLRLELGIAPPGRTAYSSPGASRTL
jgi:hypothetical protein